MQVLPAALSEDEVSATRIYFLTWRWGLGGVPPVWGQGQHRHRGGSGMAGAGLRLEGVSGEGGSSEPSASGVSAARLSGTFLPSEWPPSVFPDQRARGPPQATDSLKKEHGLEGPSESQTALAEGEASLLQSLPATQAAGQCGTSVPRAAEAGP